MLTKRMHQKNVIFVTTGIFRDIGFKYEPYLRNGCHDLMQKAMSFNDVAIAYVRENAYRIIWYMSKDDAISIMKNSNLIDKKGVL